MLILIRKISVVLLTISFFTLYSQAANKPEISASSCVLIDVDTLEILYDKNPDEVRSMASTTKIMTALIALESGKADDVVCVEDKIYIEGTAIGFNEGDKLTLETLCYAMLLESGNDAAVLAACYLAGNEEDFSALMNEKAKAIGMNNTNFVTASGLDDVNHYTTAYDMALLGAYAVKNDKFREIVSTKYYTADFVEPQISRNFSNHNRLLTLCDGVYGVKTGFTKKSGRCLVSACERNGKNLIVVTLNAPDDWNDHNKLYDYGYSLYEFREISLNIPESVKVIGSDKNEISVVSEYGNLSVYVKKDKQVQTKIYIQDYIYAPVNKNDFVGWIDISCDGILLTEISVIAQDNAEIIKNAIEYKPGLWQRLVNFICQLL